MKIPSPPSDWPERATLILSLNGQFDPHFWQGYYFSYIDYLFGTAQITLEEYVSGKVFWEFCFN